MFISIIFLSLLVRRIFLVIFVFRYVRLFLMPQDGSSVIKSSRLPTYVARATPSRVEVTLACPKAEAHLTACVSPSNLWTNYILSTIFS